VVEFPFETGMQVASWKAAVFVIAVFGCSSSASGGGSGSGTGGTSGTASADPHSACVDRINEFRATVGRPRYTRWVQQEACADDQARQGAVSGDAHSAFSQCGESAQNACPGYDSIEETLGSCLDRMWAEGPGTDFETHGHYMNMSSSEYAEVACGFHTTAEGSVWAVQDFR
jgi:hypothetical protein